MHRSARCCILLIQALAFYTRFEQVKVERQERSTLLFDGHIYPCLSSLILRPVSVTARVVTCGFPLRNTDQHRTAKKYRQVETFGDVMSRRRLSWRGQGERKDYTDLVDDDGFSISMFWYNVTTCTAPFSSTVL